MDLPAALSANLELLTDALDEPGIDLESTLRALIDDTRSAVRSYLGLTITLVTDGSTVTLTALDDTEPAAPGASALLPLHPVTGAQSGSSIVFYARQPGGFVDFAADLAFALGLPLAAVVVDRHLTPPGDLPDPTGLAEPSERNQAIGILLADGHAHPDAARELRRLAHTAHTTELAAAQQLIHDAAHRPRPDVA